MRHITGLLCGFAPWVVLALVVGGCQPAEKKPPAADMGDEAAADETSVDSDAPAVEPEATDDAPPLPEASDAPAAPEEEEPSETNSAKAVLGSDELFASIPGDGELTDEQIDAWLDDPKNHEVLEFELPMGLSAGVAQVQGVEENPLTRAKIELGRQLYFDPRLSADATISCASCHDPDEGFAKHTQFGVGIKGQEGGRNSPVSYNRILSDAQFWDGRAESLEGQAVGPIANAIEMGNTHETCVATLAQIPGYQRQFERIFGKLDIDAVGKAIASFERALVTGPTPFDYYEQLRPFEALDPEDIEANPQLKARYDKALAEAEAHPMSESAKRGRELFFTEKANCTACHVGANLTDEKYHNLGVGMDKEQPDIGRQEVTSDPKDHGAFKTPTIRNVVLSAPYMHDGSQKTLAEVVEWYVKGGHPNENLDEKIKKLDLNDQDKADLVAFMEACTGDFPIIHRGRLPQ